MQDKAESHRWGLSPRTTPDEWICLFGTLLPGQTRYGTLATRSGEGFPLLTGVWVQSIQPELVR